MPAAVRHESTASSAGSLHALHPAMGAASGCSDAGSGLTSAACAADTFETNAQELGMAFDDKYPSSMTASPAQAPATVPAIVADTAFLNTEEAGTYLRLSPRTLEKRRVLGGGPRFRKLGSRVVYTAADLRAWADSRILEMTSDPGNTERASVR